MSYARSRLWLGISTVGFIVVLSSCLLYFGWIGTFFPDQTVPIGETLGWIAIGLAAFFAVLLPFDILGGFWLPTRFGRSDQSLPQWSTRYCVGILQQFVVYFAAGAGILICGRYFGWPGAVGFVAFFMILAITIRDLLTVWLCHSAENHRSRMKEAIDSVRQWKIEPIDVLVAKHRDPGFTGGIVGIGSAARLIIPESWLAFPNNQLATLIAKRTRAVRSGSHRNGLLISGIWNLAGFGICTIISPHEVGTAAWFFASICFFSLWSFFGLLVLPTISRNASLQIDQSLVDHGIPRQLIVDTAGSMDVLQDDEPVRAPLIETIFHPIPSVDNRKKNPSTNSWSAWQVARTSLFLSWACVGLLSRAVHCNVGRPELWTLLPSD